MSTFPRLLRPPRGSFFLLGPRGTGKSTWIRATFPRAHTIDLLDERRYQAHLADPGGFARELRALERGSTVVVDEVQRLPQLLNEVHRHIEERGLRFVLCGSSAYKLKRSGTNLLAGRAALRHMHPLLPEEMGAAFDLGQALRFGTLPVVWSAPDRRDALEAYARLYLREEVQAEALVRNLPGFARFLPIAALFHGQTLNLAALARDAGVARTTAAGYLDVLTDTLVAFTLPGHEARLRVQERKLPRLYWVDPGLPRALKGGLGPPGAEERGALLEGLVASVLRAYRDYRDAFDDWAYWAAGKGSSLEVDFLLRRGSRLVAIEVKAGKSLHERSFRGLRAVADLPAVRRKVLVYLGERRQRTQDGIDILPAVDLFADLAAGRLF